MYIRKDVVEKVAWNVYVILYTIAKIKGFGSKNVRLVWQFLALKCCAQTLVNKQDRPLPGTPEHVSPAGPQVGLDLGFYVQGHATSAHDILRDRWS